MVSVEFGLKLLDQQKYPEAKDVFLELYDQSPDDPRINFGLGVVFSRFNENQRALFHLKAASKVAKKEALIFFKLAEVLANSIQHEEALAAARKAVSLNPKSPPAHILLGQCYNAVMRPVMAKVSFENALKLDPGYSGAYYELARHEAASGNIGNAREILAKARKLSLETADLTGLELWLADGGASEDTIISAKDLLDGLDTHTADSSRGVLSMRYARHLERSDMEAAFEYYEKARKSVYGSYDIKRRELQINAYRQFFTQDFFSDHTSASLSSDKPVFIFGMPRSGTTLSEQIIANHRHASGIGENQFFLRLQREFFGASEFTPRIFDVISNWQEKDFKKAGKDYLKLLDGTAKKARRVVNKMPHNFEMLWMIALLFPNAKFIHMKRNPADTCSSIYTTTFDSWHNYNIDQRTLGKYYKLYEDLMDHWKSVLPIEIYDLEYEKLVSDQEGESRKLIEHIGLEWDPACLEFYNSDSQVLTASQTQVRQPVYQSSLERWKKYEKHIQPLLEELGMA